MTSTHLQRNQPPGVPPLELTGERTLPDVPEENYWYRRHLAVYRWVAGRCAGLRVLDMACGEGYGSAVLGDHAREVVGVDANAEALEHARLKYAGPGLFFVRALAEQFEDGAQYDAIVFLQTIEHMAEPERILDHLRLLLSPAGALYVSTPNRLTLAPAGEERSDNPWHLREYAPEEFRSLLDSHFTRVEVLGVFHARKLRAHDLALRLGWDRVHRALRLSDRFYRRFVPAISERDFELRSGSLDRALDFVAVCHP